MRRYVSFAVVALVLALAVTLIACGGDRYAGTWSAANAGTFTIAKSDEGNWSVDIREDNRAPFTATEVDGQLRLESGATFARSGDTLQFRSLPGGNPVDLTLQ